MEPPAIPRRFTLGVRIVGNARGLGGAETTRTATRIVAVVRKVESDAKVTAVKSWVEIVREYDERRKHEQGPEQDGLNDQPSS